MPKPEDPVLNNAQKEHIVLLTKASETLQRIYARNPLSKSQRHTHHLKTTLSELLEQKITEIQENKKLTAISKEEQDMINTATAAVINHIDHRIEYPILLSDKTLEEYQEIKSKLNKLLPKLIIILNDEGQTLRDSNKTFKQYNKMPKEEQERKYQLNIANQNQLDLERQYQLNEAWLLQRRDARLKILEEMMQQHKDELARIEGKPHNNEQLLLTPEQIALAKAYFNKNPNQTKLSRKTQIMDNNGKPVLLPYSIMKSNDQQLYALYRGKDDNLNPQNKKGLLGKGSFGRVKLAQCLNDGTIVAAKMALISKSQSIDSMSQEEAMQEAVGQYLDSTNRENDSHENKYYIFSKFIEGESLTNVFFDPTQPESLVPKPDNSTNHERNLKIILATLKATQELHEKGITHCDLSFNNILYDLKTGDVTIIDYGHAVKFKSGFREDDPLRTLPYQIEFNPNNYTPPEFAYSTVNNRSDIYSLGRWINQAKLQPDILQRLADNMTNRDPLKRLSAKACMKIIETPELNRINTPHQNRKRR